GSGGGPSASPARAADAAAATLEAAPAEAASPGGAADEAATAGAEDTVRVELTHVPRGAVIRVDGEPATIDGRSVVLPRDGRTHRIVVRAGAGRWSARHTAEDDGRYRVRLGPGRARRAEPADGASGLFRELDY
ncbi:MAG TPA: hypothetical protein RMH99_20810, partial [Sandaracinaceae bacterium LLY-WYZ-13_1]|nr:hypothetical protein [Sandaracinaceae bacterium LLY-WYZ-13_1]